MQYTVQRFRRGYAVRWTDQAGKSHRYRLESTDRQSAEAEARSRWVGTDRSPWTVGRIAEEYLAAKALANIPSLPRRNDAWKAMKDFWNKVLPEMIDDQMADNYRASRKVGDATARYELMMVSTMLRWAVKQNRITSARSIKLPPTPPRKTRHLTRDEFARLFDGFKRPHAQLYALIGVYTMARPSAILDLTWDRVDMQRGLIDFNPPERAQTKKYRPIVPFGLKLRAALEEHYRARTSVYVVEFAGKQVANIKKSFIAASERSSVHATPYTLRHTGAVWAAEGGVPMPELAQMMGHETDHTTQIHYARFTPGRLLNVAEAIEGST